MHSRNLRYLLHPIAADHAIFAIVFRALLHKMERRLHTAQPICIIHCINAICNVQRNSWYTDAISHEFYKNGKTYQNSDNMSLSEIKQLLM